jgi:ankyrin repeat protein
MKRKLEEKTPKEQRAIKLIKSITTGDVAEAKQLISEMSNKEIDAVDEFGNTALHIAAEEGMQEVCKMLIPKMSHGAINAVTTDLFSSNTALHIAAEEGMQEVCKMLIPEMSKKAINAADNYGRTALHIAAGERHKEVCELLIPEMSEEAINAVTTDLFSSKTALHYAAENGMQEVCKLLIPEMSKKAINAVTTDLFSSKTALHYAVNNGIFSGKTALHYAAENGMQEVCKMLIPEMSEEAINSVDKFGNTILHYATEEGMQEVYEMLISNMPPEAINAVDENGKTALDYATERSSKKIVDTKKRLEEIGELLYAFVENLQSSKKMVNYKEEEIYLAKVVHVADKKTLLLKEAEDYITKCISEGSVRIEGTNLLIEHEKNEATIKWRNITGGQNTIEESAILSKLAETAKSSIIYMDVSNVQQGTQKSSTLSSEGEDVGPRKVYNYESQGEVSMSGDNSQEWQ